MTLINNNKTTQDAVKPSAEIKPLLRVSSKDILQGHQEIEIEHMGMLYRFRCTSLGKLILTK